MGRSGAYLAAASVALVATLAILAAPGTAAAAGRSDAPPKPGKTIERPVRSEAADAGKVAESYVRVYTPLPESAGEHPPRCDWIGYLRFRSPAGPRRAAAADAVLVSMPGIFPGASMHDQLARNVVRRAAKRDRHVEYWALDRRSNCLEDHRGVRAADRAEESEIAFDYYWRGREVRGRKFGGFKSAEETGFLREVGLEQTVRDWYAVLRSGIPNRRTRRKKVLCGGHSLGGPLTTAFAGWDFDGDPETRRDAGYMQCAGFFGLDTTLGFGGSEDEEEGSSGGGVGDALAAASGASPYLSVPPLTPETIQILGPIGVGAFHEPGGTDVLSQIPESGDIALSQRLLYSRDAVNFATQEPSIRDFRLTNEVVLAGILDDNSQPVTILRVSLGTVDGGPVAEKNFPAHGDSPFSVPLTDNRHLVIPSETSTPAYSWRGYRSMDERGAVLTAVDGPGPFTSPASEFADLREHARIMFEARANWAEQYFPTRIVTDIGAAEGGDRGGDLEHLAYDGISRRPAFLIQAGDSDRNTGPEPAMAGDEAAPNEDPLSGAVVLPGYNHIDVTAAAWRQPGRRPEAASRNLIRFALRAIRSPRSR